MRLLRLRMRLGTLMLLVVIVAMALGLVAQQIELGRLRRGYASQKQLHAVLMAAKIRAEAGLSDCRGRESMMRAILKAPEERQAALWASFEKDAAARDARRDAIIRDADRQAKSNVDRAWRLTP